MKLKKKAQMSYRFWRYRLVVERSSLQWVSQQNLKGTTVLDIGANRGIYSYWLSKKTGPTGKVIAFEPQPELLPHLMEVKRAFNLVNLEIEPFGLSNNSSNRILYRKAPGHGGASFEILESQPDLSEVKVPVKCLDDYHDRLNGLSLIKCDVESHELNVLKGAQKILRTSSPLLLIECHDDRVNKVARFLESFQYTGSFFYGRDKYPIDRFNDLPYPRQDRHRNYIFNKSN